ncbi:AraC family transcriptional regulator [Paenibacillus elgii]|uniref:AraC family transcriptional regulator n=1 Tax=Paenibacillus elgii TaxID=189691 RepID=A0A2T6G1K7_9BACL|nr:helix-turn-helix transcriptional regulator [Paenibacillus elgii]PUA38059.1 AraC family transcriptional regulator [Paenibacillus elgii]
MMHSYRPVQSPKLQPELHHPGYIYREYVPGRQLASHIACYWTMDFQAGNGNPWHRVLPDGCVDIIVDLHSPSYGKAAFVEGLSTRYKVLHFTKARSVFGIRLYSESARTFLKYPLSAIVGHHVFLEELWGAEGRLMAEEIMAAKAASDIVATVERKLSQMLACSDTSSPSLVYQSTQYMYEFKGNLSVTDLAEKVNFSERHLRRAFDRELGLSPKEMLGIVRFQSLLQEFSSGGYSSLTDLAIKYGYYDQSHFAKDFARYYGLPPKRMMKKG